MVVSEGKDNSKFIVVNIRDSHYRVGKTSLAMAQNCKVPLVIVKKKFERAKNKTKGYNFVCCLDGSDHSLKTLKAAKDLARNLNDKVREKYVNKSRFIL